jgi:exonuclease SbcC
VPEDHQKDPSVLRNQAKTLEEKIASTTRLHQQLQEEIQQLTGELLRLQGELSACVQSKNNFLLQEKQLELEINDCLKGSTFKKLEEVQAILSNPLNLEKLRNNLEDYRRRIYNVKMDLQELKEALAGKEFDPEVFVKLQTEEENRKQEVQQLNDRLVALKHELGQLQKDLETRQKLDTELTILQEKAENLKVLKQLFKGSGFINYLSSVYLHNLCEAANERFFKLTRQRLRLEVTENNDFQVRDFLNDGKTRSVKTLSGGQTFQASLSLALALADSVQQQNLSSHHFFFLDEGFGSLDKESLQTVFATLKALRKENRIVGIISHVEELQQEIDACLEIHNDPENGSMVRTW